MSPDEPLFREALIDTTAIADNVRVLRSLAGTPEFIAVVKANGYGHGQLEAARAAISGGATRIATADLDEALTLARAGVSAVPILCWLHPPRAFDDANAAGIELGVGSIEQLDAAARAARAERPTLVHLKLDTGLARGGAAPASWPTMFERAREHEDAGRIHVRGLFSHLSGTTRDDDLAQADRFAEAIRIAHARRLDPPILHLAATAATLTLPQTRFSGVRVGLGIYGLSPSPEISAAAVGLRPAMTVRAPVIATRRVEAGQGVSYGHSYRTPRATTLALVPLGYADGVPRQASNRASVTLDGRRYPVAGRIAMDQFVIDVGDDPVRIGDLVTLFGDPAAGELSADTWAEAADTINYDIVTRIGARCRRVTATSS